MASFAECNGKLFAAAYDTVYERADGKSPAWKKVFGTTIHAQSNQVTGFRGLTCIGGPSGTGDVMLVGVEDNPSAIYRIDPREIGPSGECSGTLELNVSSFLTKALGTETTYAIVAYNNMTKYPDPVNGSNVLIGLEAATPFASHTFAGRHTPNGYYLVRDGNSGYAVREIRDFLIEPKPELESMRTMADSPFPTDHRARYMREGSIRTATRCITRLGCIRAFRCRETAAGIEERSSGTSQRIINSLHRDNRRRGLA